MATKPTTAVSQEAASVRPVAVIDVGATSIRMAIAEIDEAGGVRTLETLTQAVSLGKDTFTQGFISKATIEDCVRVLKSYRRTLQEFQVRLPEQIRVIATSAVREASNRLAFLDRIYIATGIQVEALDEAEVSRVTYMGIQPFLQAEPALAASRSIVIEVGGGSTEVLAVKHGNVTFSHTYRLGSLRLRKTLERFRAPNVNVLQIMERQIQQTVERIREHIPKRGSNELIALGGDVRFAAVQLLPEWDRSSLARIPVAELDKLTNQIAQDSEEELVRKYHLSFPQAETVGPALLAYLELAKTYDLNNILVTNVNLRDGLLKEMAVKGAWTEEFSKQIIRSALNLGRKFEVDEEHARHVAELCSMVFEQLSDVHQLDSRYRVLLHVAALLHEIGLFISQRSNHKHAMYLINNSDLFGLGKKELLLVALVARYHRRASPQPRHEGYATLGLDDRIAVAKMAAMLRVAIALDASRSQRIKQFQCVVEQGRLVISVPQVEDLSLEQMTLRENGALFEETFGLQVLLRTVRW